MAIETSAAEQLNSRVREPTGSQPPEGDTPWTPVISGCEEFLVPLLFITFMLCANAKP